MSAGAKIAGNQQQHATPPRQLSKFAQISGIEDNAIGAVDDGGPFRRAA